MVDKIRVTPSALAPNYAPAYLAEDLGFFAEQDLEVDSTVYAGPGSSWLADNLLDAKAEIALGGIWIPLMYREHLASFGIFAQVCRRNPQVIIGRVPVDDFSWELLYGKKLLLPLNATSQWMFLEGVLLESKVDLSRIRFIRDLDAATMNRLWRAGFADYYLVTPPLSEQFEREGSHIVTSLAEVGGAVPWSVYYTTTEFLKTSEDKIVRFARAINRSMAWLEANDPSAIADALRRRFPELEVSTLTLTVSRLKARGIWPTSVEVPQDSYMRYQRIIAAFGLIPKTYPFSAGVETRVAQAA